MADVVVTVPQGMWQRWLAEGDLPGQEAEYVSHFWLPRGGLPDINRGERVYIVAHGRLRGYAPLTGVEQRCTIPGASYRSCLMREGDAVAVTIPEAIRGFQGFRYRWWARETEQPFPDWMTPEASVMAATRQLALGL